MSGHLSEHGIDEESIQFKGHKGKEESKLSAQCDVDLVQCGFKIDWSKTKKWGKNSNNYVHTFNVASVGLFKSDCGKKKTVGDCGNAAVDVTNVDDLFLALFLSAEDGDNLVQNEQENEKTREMFDVANVDSNYNNNKRSMVVHYDQEASRLSNITLFCRLCGLNMATALQMYISNQKSALIFGDANMHHIFFIVGQTGNNLIYPVLQREDSDLQLFLYNMGKKTVLFSSLFYDLLLRIIQYPLYIEFAEKTYLKRILQPKDFADTSFFSVLFYYDDVPPLLEKKEKKMDENESEKKCEEEKNEDYFDYNFNYYSFCHYEYLRQNGVFWYQYISPEMTDFIEDTPLLDAQCFDEKMEEHTQQASGETHKTTEQPQMTNFSQNLISWIETSSSIRKEDGDETIYGSPLGGCTRQQRTEILVPLQITVPKTPSFSSFPRPSASCSMYSNDNDLNRSSTSSCCSSIMMCSSYFIRQQQRPGERTHGCIDSKEVAVLNSFTSADITGYKVKNERDKRITGCCTAKRQGDDNSLLSTIQDTPLKFSCIRARKKMLCKRHTSSFSSSSAAAAATAKGYSCGNSIKNGLVVSSLQLISSSCDFRAVEVLPNLFLGSYSDACNIDALAANGISLVLNVAAECEVTEAMLNNKYNIRFKHIPLKDDSDENIANYFEPLTRMIHRELHLCERLSRSKKCIGFGNNNNNNSSSCSFSSSSSSSVVGRGISGCSDFFSPSLSSLSSEMPFSSVQLVGGVLVHCHAGISRSVTIILAYIMIYGYKLVAVDNCDNQKKLLDNIDYLSLPYITDCLLSHNVFSDNFVFSLNSETNDDKHINTDKKEYLCCCCCCCCNANKFYQRFCSNDISELPTVAVKYRSAFKFLKKLKSDINPNFGFILALQGLENKIK